MARRIHRNVLKRTLNLMFIILQIRFLMMLMHVVNRRKNGNHVSIVERPIMLKIITLRGIMIFLNPIINPLKNNGFLLLHI